MSKQQEDPKEEEENTNQEINWLKTWFITYLQILSIYGFVLIFHNTYFLTVLFSIFLICLGIIGDTAGAHRLWAHRSYEATTSLKVFLMLCQTLVGQGSIYNWVKYHRLHHQCFGTNQDPFNPSKGFWFSHFICLTKKRTTEQEELADKIDMSDLESDKVVMFQKKYYKILYFLIVMVIPLYIPMTYWGETILHSAGVAGFFRAGVLLHFSWLIHSATTILGLKKGERYPLDTNLVFLINKTYWLQYHYVAPWDYQTSEFGNYGSDYISAFIRVCAALEMATDLRTINGEGVRDALYKCLETKEEISQCLSEVEMNIPRDHYLRPQKFYYNF